MFRGRVKMCEFFMYIVAFKIILVWKGVMCMFGEGVKMFEFCRYAFLKSKSIQAKNVQTVRQNRLFTTTKIV